FWEVSRYVANRTQRKRDATRVDSYRYQVTQRRIKKGETPVRSVVGKVSIDCDTDCVVSDRKRELVEGQGKAKSTRLDIALLECPVREKTFPLLGGRQISNRADLGQGKEAVRDLDHLGVVVGPLGVNADLLVSRAHRAHHQPRSVCQA